MIPPEVAISVKGRLGPIYDELLVVMLDLEVPPIFLFADDRPRLAEVRDRAVSCLEEWSAEGPAAEHLVSLLPPPMQLSRSTLRAPLPSPAAFIRGRRGKTAVCPKYAASQMVVFPDPFAPTSTANRPGRETSIS